MTAEVISFNRHDDWRERGYHLRMAPVVFACYDPAGGGTDNDALVLLSREEHQKGEPHDPDFAVAMKYRVLATQIFPSQWEFPDKLARMLALDRNLQKWELAGKSFAHFMGVETNGVGWAMASALRVKISNRVLAYTTVASTSAKPFENGKLSMPRLAALDHMRVLLETHHLKLAPDAPGGKELAHEMGSFVWGSPGRPEAIKGQRDDRVMALAGAVWLASTVVPPVLRAKRYNGTTTRSRRRR